MSAGGVKASGHLRVSGAGRLRRRACRPAGAGIHVRSIRMCSISLDLIRPAGRSGQRRFRLRGAARRMPDSSLVSLMLGENRRVCVASPAYLEPARRAAQPRPLSRSTTVSRSARAPDQQRGWMFQHDGKVGIDQGIGHDGMLGRRGAPRVVSRRLRPRVALVVGSRRGHRGRAGSSACSTSSPRRPSAFMRSFPQRRHLQRCACGCSWIFSSIRMAFQTTGDDAAQRVFDIRTDPQ